jgi:hypothetical protein
MTSRIAAVLTVILVLVAAGCGGGGSSGGGTSELQSTPGHAIHTFSGDSVSTADIKIKDCALTDIAATSDIVATAGAGGGTHLVITITVTCKGTGIPGVVVTVQVPGAGKTTPTKGGGTGSTDAVVMPATDKDGKASAEFDTTKPVADASKATYSVSQGFITIPITPTVK